MNLREYVAEYVGREREFHEVRRMQAKLVEKRRREKLNSFNVQKGIDDWLDKRDYELIGQIRRNKVYSNGEAIFGKTDELVCSNRPPLDPNDRAYFFGELGENTPDDFLNNYLESIRLWKKGKILEDVAEIPLFLGIMGSAIPIFLCKAYLFPQMPAYAMIGSAAGFCVASVSGGLALLMKSISYAKEQKAKADELIEKYHPVYGTEALEKLVEICKAKE